MIAKGKYPKITFKTYYCSECKYEKQIDTNHFGECYSWGRYNTCPKCPPYKKYPEFGGGSIWKLKKNDNGKKDNTIGGNT